MPVDTLFRLGTSPPSFNLFYSLGQLPLGHTGSFMHSFEQYKYAGINGNLREKPLRPCLKLDTDSSNGYSCVHLESTPKEVSVSSHASTMISETSCTEKSKNVSGKKQVRFADSKGLELHTVRIMDGPSDSPPLLLCHNLMSEVIQDERAEATHPYTYVPDFEQPASSYLDFRDRLESQNVCLESVMIKDNINILGTLKVRNISFDKSVKVRTSFDEWKTYRDFPCSYVKPDMPEEERGACAPSRYDTFSFEFELPPNLAGKAAYFCLSYRCSGATFWDNNKDMNYRIVSLQEKEAADREELTARHRSLGEQYSWSEFSSVKLEDNERPYW